MMKLSKKGVLLFALVMTACAFAMPGMASAGSWVLDSGTFPSTHVFDTSNPNNRLSFSIAAVNAGWSCGVAQFDVTVHSASDATINGAAFQSCMATGDAVNCTVTLTGTKFPWTITNTSTTDITIEGLHLDGRFENTPGNPGTCPAPYVGDYTVTGKIGGSWNNMGHEISVMGGAGTLTHLPSSGLSFATTVGGTAADTSSTLTMVD